MPPWMKHQLSVCNGPLLYLSVRGVKEVSASPRIHHSNSQLHSTRPAKEEAPFSRSNEIILPRWDIVWDLQAAHVGNHFLICWSTPPFRGAFTSCVSGAQTDVADESLDCVPCRKEALPDASVCSLCGVARSWGVTHTMLISKGVGFLASCSSSYQAPLITNSSALLTPKLWVAIWSSGWAAKRDEDRVSLFSRAVHHQGSQRRTIPKLGPDAERGGYEPAGLEGGRGRGPGPGPESWLSGAHSTSASSSSLTTTTRATRIPEASAHLPHPAGAWESDRSHSWIHKRQGAVHQDRRSVQHFPLRGTSSSFFKYCYFSLAFLVGRPAAKRKRLLPTMPHLTGLSLDQDQ